LEHPTKKKIKPERAHRFSRRARLMMLLVAAVAVAAAFVILLPTIKEKIPSQLTQSLKANLTYKTLSSGDVNVLDSITVSHATADGETYTLLYRDSELFLQAENGDLDLINEGYMDEIVKAATEIAVEDTVTEDVTEVSDHLGDMGLNPPEITVKVTYASGSTTELQIGAQVPGTTYYYYRWSGDQGVYMCDTGIHDAFTYTAHMLLPVEQPEISSALIDRLTINNQTGGEMACTFVSDGTDSWIGTLRSPWIYPMDEEKTTTLLTALKNFRLGTKIGAVTPDNRAEYGLDAPTAVIDIHQQQGLYSEIDADGVLQTETLDEQTFHFELGAMDGEYFYFCEYAGECYRVSSFLVTTLVNAVPSAYVSNAPADLGSADIAGITVQLGTGALEVKATYTEHVQANNQIETDTEGNTVYDVAVTANGDSITTDSFDALVERLKQMTVSGRLDEPVTPEGTPRWQMTITTVGGVSRTLAAYPMDTFSDILTVDGVAMHYLNSEAIQIALAELYPGA